MGIQEENRQRIENTLIKMCAERPLIGEKDPHLVLDGLGGTYDFRLMKAGTIGQISTEESGLRGFSNIEMLNRALPAITARLLDGKAQDDLEGIDETLIDTIRGTEFVGCLPNLLDGIVNHWPVIQNGGMTHENLTERSSLAAVLNHCQNVTAYLLNVGEAEITME